MTASFKNKTIATALAAIFGTLGAHRFYLEGLRSWKAWSYGTYFLVVAIWGVRHIAESVPDWTTDLSALVHPAFLASLLPTFIGFVEAELFALTPDARWDTRWNRESGRTNQSGWPVIALAVLTLAVGAMLLLTTIAVNVESFVESGEVISR